MSDRDFHRVCISDQHDNQLPLLSAKVIVLAGHLPRTNLTPALASLEGSRGFVLCSMAEVQSDNLGSTERPWDGVGEERLVR
jgi:hypothetical protein